MKHTPAPWHFDDVDNTIRDTKTNSVIATMDTYFEDVPTNARLIAASPLMYQELENAEQTLRNLGMGKLSDDARFLAITAAASIRRTLNKATS